LKSLTTLLRANYRSLLPVTLLILLVIGTGCDNGTEFEGADADFSVPDVDGSDLVFADVAGEPITAGYLVHKSRIQFPDMPQEGAALGEQMREIVGRVVDERVMVNLGVEMGLDQDWRFLRTMEFSRSYILSATAIANVITKRATPSEDSLRTYYESNTAKFCITAQNWWRHILVATENEALGVKRRLMAGALFADLAAELSIDETSAVKGGEMPPVNERYNCAHLGHQPLLGKMILSLEKDEIGDPIQTEHGWHLVQVYAARKYRKKPFEEVRQTILDKALSRAEPAMRTHVTDSLKTANNITYNDDAIQQTIDKFDVLIRDYALSDYWSRNNADSELVLAVIDGEPLTDSYLLDGLQILKPGWSRDKTYGYGDTRTLLAQYVFEMLKRLVDEWCFTKLGDEKGYDNDPLFKRTFALARMYNLTTESIRHTITKRARPSDAEVDSLYTTHRDAFRIQRQVTWRQILVDSEAKAYDVRQQLISGVDFGKLAKKISSDTQTAKRGGVMPPLDETNRLGHFGELPELSAAINELSAGEISDPIRTDRGWHVVLVDHLRKPRQLELREVRERIIMQKTSNNELTIYRDLLDSLKAVQKVTMYEDNMDQFYFLQMDDAELFEIAQRQSDGIRKRKLYEQIILRYSDSEHAPEAQFMIGFVSTEELDDDAGAIEAFERFLSDYPDHEMASSASMMLEELKSKVN
jgi:parvulin-like peptidyl-prolyl isomerase